MLANVQDATSLRYDFEATLSQLEEISRWLHSLGFTKFDRVRAYARNIEQMIALGDREDSPTAFDHISDEKGREIFWSYLDADEFVRAVAPLRQCLAEKDLVPVLERALCGPADLSFEKASNNTGRNFAFQLAVAGRLAAAGYTPLFTDETDVRFTYAGLEVAIECKRPLVFQSLERNIEAALGQLAKRKADLRIAAISLSRLFNTGDPNAMPSVRRRVDADLYLEQQVHAIAERTQRCWYGNELGSGLWFYAFIPVRCQEMPRYLMTRYEAICPATKEDLNWMILKCFQQSIPA